MGTLRLTDQIGRARGSMGILEMGPRVPKCWASGGKEGTDSQPQLLPQVLSGLAQNCVCPEEGVLFLILMEALKSPWLAVRWGLDPDTDCSSLGRQSWYKHMKSK